VERTAGARDAAAKMGATRAVVGSLSRLGTQTIGQVQLIDVAGGNVVFVLGGFGLYETPDLFAEVRYSTGIGTSSSMFGTASLSPITIGVFKTLSRSDLTPYYGGALGVDGYTSVAQNGNWYGQDGWGFVVAPGAGLMVFHTYDFHVTADLRYYLVIGGNALRHGPALSVNLAYRRSKSGGGCCGFGF
jgi:hypothetical protein